MGVCDSPDEFYGVIHSLAVELGLRGQTDSTANDTAPSPLTVDEVKTWLSIYDGQGLGYAVSTDEELKFIAEVSAASGIGFDPVYSGKALYTLFKTIQTQELGNGEGRATVFSPGCKILFIHTGGMLGMYDKAEQILPFVTELGGKITTF